MGSEIQITPTAKISLTELKDIYESAKGQFVTAADIVRTLDTIINSPSNTLTPSQIQSAIKAIRDLVVINTDEIQCLHTLMGLLVLELTEQGVKIESKELIDELKYLK